LVSVILGAVALIIITLTTVADVILRAFFNSGMTGSIEIVSYFLTAIVYFGVGYCSLKKGMITVELFKPPRVVVYVHQVLCMLMSSVIIYAATSQAFFSHGSGAGSLRLHIPKWPFMLITAFGFLMMVLTMLVNMINDIAEQRRIGLSISDALDNADDGEAIK
jgi:TRAP-type C4-dicarboxylate transport system permease small subunit